MTRVRVVQVYEVRVSETDDPRSRYSVVGREERLECAMKIKEALDRTFHEIEEAPTWDLVTADVVPFREETETDPKKSE